MSLAGHAPPPDNRAPALAAAAALHVALVAALWFFGRPPMLPPGNAVPINIVSSAPTTDSRPAEEAPQVQSAATETPVPEAPPTPPPPQPKAVAHPQPTPKAPPVKPTPTPTPSKPVPKPPQPQARQNFDFDSLQQTIDRAARSAPPRPSAAPRGPTRAETDLHARVDVGQGLSQSQIEGLGQLLNRLWNKNCEGAGPIDVIAKITVDRDGMVPDSALKLYNRSGTPISIDSREFTSTQHSTPEQVSAVRARSVIRRVQPYALEFRGQTFTINFNASKACANA